MLYSPYEEHLSTKAGILYCQDPGNCFGVWAKDEEIRIMNKCVLYHRYILVCQGMIHISSNIQYRGIQGVTFTSLLRSRFQEISFIMLLLPSTVLVTITEKSKVPLLIHFNASSALVDWLHIDFSLNI